MRFLVKAVPGERVECIKYLKRVLPQIEIVWDKTFNHMDTFLSALDRAGDDAVVHMEDDIILTKNFERKILRAIKKHPDNLIQFFSMREADLTVGSRWDISFLIL